MSLTFQQVPVTASATYLTDVPAEVQVTLTTATAVYVGGTAVTTATGALIPANVPVPLTAFRGSTDTKLYGAASSGTVAVSLAISTPR